MNLRRALMAVLASAAVSAALLVAGCGKTGTSGDATTLTVYSPIGLSTWYKSQFDAFTRETGIKVTLFEGGSGEVVSRVNSRAAWQRLDADNPVPPADLLITLPPFIQKAAKAGLLQTAGVDVAGITSPLVDPGGSYVPIAHTALCFIANPAAKPPPVTWNDLLRADLKGKLQYSTPGEAGDGTAVLLLLQELMGRQGALDYLRKLQSNNVGPAPSTAKLQTKVSSGELLVANGDVQLSLTTIRSDGAKFAIFFPAMSDGSRTTISLSYVAGVTANTRYPAEAGKLLAFLLSDDAQRALATDALGIPARDSIAKQASADAGALTPAGLLKGVRLWSPDWNAVLADLEGDVAAYQQATGS